mgnify:CR=1 FL=1
MAQADVLKREEQQIKATNEMMHMIEQMHDKMVALQNVSLFLNNVLTFDLIGKPRVKRETSQS